MKARRLTRNGLERFQQFLDSQAGKDPEEFDVEIVESFSAEISRTVDFPVECPYEKRYEVAEILAPLVDGLGLDDPGHDRGFWSWLSWMWFESIAEKREGRAVVKESARWILQLEWNRYYRHLLAGPWWIYSSHRDAPGCARSLLHTTLTRPGELVAQLAANQALVGNAAVVTAATELYLGKTGMKRGHAGKAGGSARRFVRVLSQLDLVWDLHSLTVEQVLGLLPSEFDKYQS